MTESESTANQAGTTLKIGFEPQAFIADLAQEIATPGVRPIDAIERLLSQHMTLSLRTALGKRFTKEPIARVIPYYSNNAFAVLSDLEAAGYETWYPELKFSTKSEDVVNSVEIDPSGILLEPIEYGFGIKRIHNLKVKPLKTQTNHILRLNHLKIGGEVFVTTRQLVEKKHPLIQPYLANPSPYFRENGKDIVVGRDEFVAFDHITNGARVFCSCAKPAHDQIRENSLNIRHQYVADSWPHHIIRFLEVVDYVEGLCHLCVSRFSGPETAAYRYGDNLQAFVEPYTRQLARTGGFDERTARAEVQQHLGLSRWLREAEMYQIVKKIFQDTLVLREASPAWLGRQRLDVYLPQLKLALEYQGQQHYQPVSLFGGVEALERTVERDTLKKRLCEANGIDLVYVHFNDPLTVASLKHRLRRFLNV